ncbi:hypothetical protein F4859DRAFT_515973 [Xylaria cf. heliscus]|nr:hypothetical protein F4859DRAFT_515973 [Xylaria cf. heliscus]
MDMHKKTHVVLLDPIPNRRKRKYNSDGDIQQVNLAPRLRNPHNLFVLGADYGQRQKELKSFSETAKPTSSLSSNASYKVHSSTTPVSEISSLTSLTSCHDSMLERDGPPRGPGSLPSPKSVFSSCLSVEEWLKDADSLNSVRWPDPLDFSDRMPNVIVDIPAFLFRPRPPPVLPQHILDFDFARVLRRYRRLNKLIDDYQRWHGRTVFAFWTADEISLAAMGEVPALTEAYVESRPSIPPRILSTRFDIVLLTAPLLSHLIERYHNDLGYDYFAFYRTDPRGHQTESDSDSSHVSSYDWDVFAGLCRLALYKK